MGIKPTLTDYGVGGVSTETLSRIGDIFFPIEVEMTIRYDASNPCLVKITAIGIISNVYFPIDEVFVIEADVFDRMDDTQKTNLVWDKILSIIKSKQIQLSAEISDAKAKLNALDSLLA